MVIGLLLTALAAFNPLGYTTGGSHVISDAPVEIFNSFTETIDLANRSSKLYSIDSYSSTTGLSLLNEKTNITSMTQRNFFDSIYNQLETETIDKYTVLFQFYRIDDLGNYYWDFQDSSLVSHKFYCFMRVCFPWDAPINALELYNTNGFTAVCIGGNSPTTSGRWFSNVNDGHDVWCGIYNSTHNEHTDNQGNIMSESPNMRQYGLFTEYIFGFESINLDSTYKRIKITFEIDHIDSDYVNGNNFQIGYNLGYSQGNSDGYTQGYAEARDYFSTHDSSFMSLFGAIADTPIKMLYGLFNFDLLGVSVITIVLTCLTGVVLFGIVKRFIK